METERCEVGFEGGLEILRQTLKRPPPLVWCDREYRVPLPMALVLGAFFEDRGDASLEPCPQAKPLRTPGAAAAGLVHGNACQKFWQQLPKCWQPLPKYLAAFVN